jgi:hypothetical protein
LDFLAIYPLWIILFTVILIMWRSIDTQLKNLLKQNKEIIKKLNEYDENR